MIHADFELGLPFTLSLPEIENFLGAKAAGTSAKTFQGFAPLKNALQCDISFCDSRAFVDDLKQTRAGLVFVSEKLLADVPATSLALIVPSPMAAYVSLSRHAHAHFLKPQGFINEVDEYTGAYVDETAEIEWGVIIEPQAVIGKNAIIGANTTIGAGAIIGNGVTIGRDCSIGALTHIQAAHLGNRVILHAGVKIGQDGFGYHFARGVHLKIPQVGRVIIQDDVEIGANTTIDRGAIRDTFIGEGTKIDNQVQIGHNVTVGRHCILVSKVAIGGSTTLEDYVVLAGGVLVNNGVHLGMGVKVAAMSGVKDDLQAGQAYGGIPARPFKDYLREVTFLSIESKNKRAKA
jgi:UDP-3-O-[3-hydroxymyristoyl] glucosamine N-acyltransferase